MASINSLMSSSSSSTSSIYGNSNVISGLASGMDTEAMIENAVSGIKNKLTGFNQDKTMLEWEQTAYRNIIDKLLKFSDKYTTFASSTNLFSDSFFDAAIKTTSTGTYADLLSISGESSLDFEVLGATKAKNAGYSGKKLTEIKNDLTVPDEGVLKLTMEQLGVNEDSTSMTFKVGNGAEKTLTVGKNETLEAVLNRISSETGVKASYSATTGGIYLKSEENGAAGTFTFSGDLAGKLFGANTVNAVGEDAKLTIRVNGENTDRVVSSATDSFDIDGMKIMVKNAFTVDAAKGETAVSFSTHTDTDKIVNAIKSMVEDFNTMANEIKDAYTTKPLTNSSGKRYKPLIEEDAKDMSEDAIKKYEEKAKTGLLFADRNISSLYSELRDAISNIDLEEIGISTAYANGKTTMVLDEQKLRGVIESDPDKVKTLLNKEPEDTTKRGGLMYSLKETVTRYTEASSTKKGILVELAGSEKADSMFISNTYKTKMDRLQEQIERWQNKLSDKVDYYTKQFTALEKLVSQMNSQSSALYGMMGY